MKDQAKYVTLYNCVWNKISLMLVKKEALFLLKMDIHLEDRVKYNIISDDYIKGNNILSFYFFKFYQYIFEHFKNKIYKVLVCK